MKSWKVYLKYNTNLEKQFQLVYFVNTYSCRHMSRLTFAKYIYFSILDKKKLIGTYIRGCQIDNAEPYLQFFKFDMPTGSTTNIVIWTSYYLLNQLVKFVFSKKTTKINKIFIVDLTVCSKCQIDGEDLVKFCGLLRKHEL